MGAGARRSPLLYSLVAHAPLLQPADPTPKAPLHPAPAAEQSHSRVEEAVQVTEPRATRTVPAAVVPPKRQVAREAARPTATSAERARSSRGSVGGGGRRQEIPRTARGGGGGGGNTTHTASTAHATPSPVPSQLSHSQLTSEQQIAEAALRAVMNRRTHSSVRTRLFPPPLLSVYAGPTVPELLPTPPHSIPPFRPPLWCGASGSGDFSSVGASVCVLIWPVQGFSSDPPALCRSTWRRHSTASDGPAQSFLTRVVWCGARNRAGGVGAE